ncbi:MAG TPA: NDP-sugar synthase [Abditibacteriaceae bacterium]|jgi:mannose-1-phosphate guanylyltransferase/phosphomannomutase
MILAAGVGSRLDPLTRNVPKPMVPIVNQPVIEHLVRLLVKHGFHEIAANTHYLADQIEGYFNDGASLGAQMRFNREAELLGTAGGVKRVADSWNFFTDGETFCVTGGDDFTDLNLTEMLDFHRASGAVATIGLAKVEDPSQFGVVVLDDMDSERGGSIKSFVEKPPAGTAPSNLVNTGVYLFEPEVLDLIPAGKFYDFGKELFPLLLEQGKPFFGFKTNDYWRDVGNLAEYREAHQDFFAGQVDILPNVELHEKDIWIGENCTIHPTAVIEAPVVIGPNCTIGAHARVTGGSVLGESCVLADGATVNQSILWARSHVEGWTHLDKCIVGFDCHVYSNAAIFGGTIVSPHKK